jgi:hypothetical protein
MKPSSQISKAVPPRWALLLALPALIPLANACLVPWLKGTVPTGFIQYDMPYYMASAREHFDQGFQLTYGNPYAQYGTPAVYSQPQIFLLAILQHMGLSPGLAFNLFGVASLFFAAWVAVQLYQQVVGLETTAKKLGLVCFFWGGGLVTAAGFSYSLIKGHLSWSNILKFDPSQGWWMLNFGRNLVYPTEAYYHGVFLLSLLLLIRRQFVGSLALAALLSWSHPFGGLSLALILIAYAAVELVLRSGAASPLTLVVALLIAVGHIGYYLIFLNRFSDHRALQSQWALSWLYPPRTYLPVLAIVGLLALRRLTCPPGLRQTLKDSRTRLFLVWFAVIFALSQHNLIVKPRQPIHFAHGYDWIALFFIGAPVLIGLLERGLSIPRPLLRVAVVGCVLAVMLLDNVVWFAGFLVPTGNNGRIELTNDQESVLDWLGKHASPPDMVVCDDQTVSYLVSTYTRVRSWRGHFFNTPMSLKRGSEVDNVFQHEQFLPQWEQSHVFYVSLRGSGWKPPPGDGALFSNRTYTIWGNPLTGAATPSLH